MKAKRLLGAISILILATSLTGCQGRDRKAKCFVFPKARGGWFVVDYEVRGATPLPLQGDCLQIDFRSNSHIQTSNRIEQGWATDRYFRESDQGMVSLPYDPSNPAVPGVRGHVFQFSGVQRTESSREVMFLGTRKEFAAAKGLDKVAH